MAKTEVVNRRGPFKTLADVEFAVMEWVDWCNNRRLHGEIGHIPPVEHEAIYDREYQPTPAGAIN